MGSRRHGPAQSLAPRQSGRFDRASSSRQSSHHRRARNRNRRHHAVARQSCRRRRSLVRRQLRAQGSRQHTRRRSQSIRQAGHHLPEERAGPSPSCDSAVAAEYFGQGTAQSMPARPPSNYAVHYDEGAEVGYKWYQTQHKTPLFPFGFGLSYTSFAYSGSHCRFSRKNCALHRQQHRHSRRH